MCLRVSSWIKTYTLPLLQAFTILRDAQRSSAAERRGGRGACGSGRRATRRCGSIGGRRGRLGRGAGARWRGRRRRRGCGRGALLRRGGCAGRWRGGRRGRRAGAEVQRGVVGDVAEALEEALDPRRAPVEVGEQGRAAGLGGGEERDNV